jgi:hypothetical protein
MFRLTRPSTTFSMVRLFKLTAARPVGVVMMSFVPSGVWAFW